MNNIHKRKHYTTTIIKRAIENIKVGLVTLGLVITNVTIHARCIGLLK